MKKANTIDIRTYPANIEIFANRDDDDGTWEGSGRILSIHCDADSIPSAMYLPTIPSLHQEAQGFLTKNQCREIKDAVRQHCHWI